MAFYANPTVLANGPAHIRDNCTRIAVVSAYTFGDSYATVVAAILADRTVDSADFTLATVGNSAVLTSAAGPSDAVAVAGGGGATSHFVFLDDVNDLVLRVTEESTDQVVTIDNPVNFPATTYTLNQPVAA